MRQSVREINKHLVKVFGSQVAMKIMRELTACSGGKRLTIPTEKTLNIITRRQEVQEMYDKSCYTASRLAAVFNVSESTIKKDLQCELFPITEEV